MDRNEILEKSQQENRGRDVADMEVSKNGIRIAWLVTALLAIGVGVGDYFAFGRPCYELLFVVSVGLFTVFLCKYIALKKRHELFVAICHGVAAAAWCAAWIMQIIGG